MSWQSKATESELLKLRKYLLFRHQEETETRKLYLIAEELYKIGHELNKRCNTTKYLPR